MKITRWTTVIASMLSLAAGACARNPELQAETSNGDVSLDDGSVIITVKNNNFADMNVYAVVDRGPPIRLGTVTGLSSSTLSARPSLFSTGTLRLIASPIGGDGVGRSGPLAVGKGQSVVLRLNPTSLRVTELFDKCENILDLSGGVRPSLTERP